MLQVLTNIIRSVGYLILIHVVVVFLLYKMFWKSSKDGASSDSKIQKINDKEAAYLVKIDDLNKIIERKDIREDSFALAIKERDIKLEKKDKELAKFKTLKNEKRSVIDQYTTDGVDSAFTAEGFHPYKVKSIE
jgi:hypothetical protein